MEESKLKPRQYFSREVEDSIIQYNDTRDKLRKNFLYRKVIYPAFDKLAENLIHTFKFYYFEIPYLDVKHEVVTYLTEKLSNYTREKGKAFSFFSIIGKNYLIFHNNANYKKFKSKETLESVDEEKDILVDYYNDEVHENLSDFIDIWVTYVDRNLDFYGRSQEDRVIIDSILTLFKSRKYLDSFHKKKLYILIREHTGLRTPNITKVLDLLKKDFYRRYEEYQKSLSF